MVIVPLAVLRPADMAVNMHAPCGMWLCMKRCDTVHGCMVYTERAEMATVSSGTSNVRTKQRCNYTTVVDIQSTL